MIRKGQEIKMKLFAIFGVMCVLLEDNTKKCMNFWEEPVVKYQTKDECGTAAYKKGREIELKFMNQGLDIDQLYVYCLPIDNKPKT